MKLSELANKAQERGLQLSIKDVLTDREGNILRIVIDYAGGELLREAGYLFNSEPEEDTLFEYVPDTDNRDSFIDEQLRALRIANKAGDNSAELIERLISIAASLQESIKFYRAELEAVQEQI